MAQEKIYKNQLKDFEVIDKKKIDIVGLRILFVFCSFELGGSERQGLHLAKYLKENGFDIFVCSTLDGNGRVKKECEKLKIPYFYRRFLWPCRKKSLIFDGFKFLKRVRAENPTIIISYNTAPNIVCGLTWRFSKAKGFIWGQRNIHGLNGGMVEKIAYSQASFVVCNANHEIEYLKKTVGVAKSPIKVIKNGRKLVSPKNSQKEWRDRLNIPENDIIVLMLANFREHKDHHTLLKAWVRLQEILKMKCKIGAFLVLAGAEQNTFEKIKKLGFEFGINESLRFPGPVQDISGLMAASDIGVLISKSEGFSNSIIEYMLSGLPVVATDLPGNREALGEEAIDLLCVPGDPYYLAEILHRLIIDKDLRQKIGERNRKRSQKEFTLEKMCDKMTNIIEQIIHENS